MDYLLIIVTFAGAIISELLSIYADMIGCKTFLQKLFPDFRRVLDGTPPAGKPALDVSRQVVDVQIRFAVGVLKGTEHLF